MRTKSAASIAMSVPAPIAIPTSAAANAGASLIPSPTIATTGAARRATSTVPFNVFLIGGAFSSSIFPAFPAGETSACTETIPHSAAIALAVCQLSPVTR
eukprot:31176-Pelagococcus_subviridis.AAC.43